MPSVIAAIPLRPRLGKNVRVREPATAANGRTVKLRAGLRAPSVVYYSGTLQIALPFAPCARAPRHDREVEQHRPEPERDEQRNAGERRLQGQRHRENDEQPGDDHEMHACVEAGSRSRYHRHAALRFDIPLRPMPNAPPAPAETAVDLASAWHALGNEWAQWWRQVAAGASTAGPSVSTRARDRFSRAARPARTIRFDHAGLSGQASDALAGGGSDLARAAPA